MRRGGRWIHKTQSSLCIVLLCGHDSQHRYLYFPLAKNTTRRHASYLFMKNKHVGKVVGVCWRKMTRQSLPAQVRLAQLYRYTYFTSGTSRVSRVSRVSSRTCASSPNDATKIHTYFLYTSRKPCRILDAGHKDLAAEGRTQRLQVFCIPNPARSGLSWPLLRPATVCL